MGGSTGTIVGLTASGIFDGGLNLIGKYLNGETYIPYGAIGDTGLSSITISELQALTGTISYIYDGGLNIAGVNDLSHPIIPDVGPSTGTVSFIGLTSSPLAETGPSGTASINGLYDGGMNVYGYYDNVNQLTYIIGLTRSHDF